MADNFTMEYHLKRITRLLIIIARNTVDRNKNGSDRDLLEIEEIEEAE